MELTKLQRKWIAQLSEWRMVIDNYSMMCDKQLEKSAEITLSKRSLQLCRGWLGTMKDSIRGVETSQTYAPIPKDISPSDDRGKCPPLPFGEHLMNINDFIASLNRIRVALRALMIEIDLHAETNIGEEFILPMRYAVKHMEESGIWLTHELQRIREQYLLNNPTQS